MDNDLSGIDRLVAEATHAPMSRLAFISRAFALGLSATAVAGVLADIEGPAAALAAPSRKTANLSFSSWGSPDEQSTIHRVLDVFHQRHAGINVTPRLSSWSDYWPKYNADVAAHSTADVQFLTFVPGYAEKGALYEIRSLLTKHGKSLPKGYTKGQLSLFEYKKGVYGVPRDNDTKVIFYNKDLFRKAGVAFPKSTWTYDDLRRIAKKLTVRQGSRVVQYGYAFESGQWRLYIWQHGSELFDNDQTPHRLTFDNARAADGIQFMADLINKDKVTPAPTQIVDSTTIGPLFTSGQLAMAFGNHGLVPQLVATPNLKWDVVGMPHFKGYKTVNVAGGAGYTISRWTKDPSAALQLWQFMTGPVASLVFASGNDLVPNSPAALHSKQWLSKPYNKVFTQQTKLGHDFPSFPQWNDVANAIGAALDKVWTGETTARQALHDAVAPAEKALKGP
ncbi:MAG: sugar ABC transporter substrate-binding protein [Chloroflexota bacterium]